MNRSNSSCHTHKKKKEREDETGKIAPLFKKENCCNVWGKIVVLSNEELLKSFTSIDFLHEITAG